MVQNISNELRNRVKLSQLKLTVNASSYQLIYASLQDFLSITSPLNGFNFKIDHTGTASNCKVCEQEVGSGHKCVRCKGFVHLICGKPVSDEEEGYGQNVVCFKCEKQGKQYFLFVLQRLFKNPNKQQKLDFTHICTSSPPFQHCK